MSYDAQIMDQPNDHSFRIVFDSRIYEKEAVMTASREMSSYAQLNISICDKSDIAVDIIPLSSCYCAHDLEQKLRDFLIDSQIRIDLNRKFGVIRELIVKQAFAPIANLKSELQKIK